MDTKYFNDFYVKKSPNWNLNDFPRKVGLLEQFSANGKGYILSGDGDDHDLPIMVSFRNITLVLIHGQNYNRTQVVLDGHLDPLFLVVMYILQVA